MKKISRWMLAVILIACGYMNGSAQLQEKRCAFVKFRSGDAEQLLAKYGCEKVTQIGDIYIANIPLTQMKAMAADGKVERIEAQMGGKLLNDVSPQWVNNQDIYAGVGLPQAYDGSGVLLGIVDGGYDMTHPSLYALDGKTYRVKGFVDDYADKDETLGIQTPLGREYLTEAEILGNKYVGDSLGNHGAHTLATAAGSGYGSPYRGMAYGADLFVISSKNASEDYFANSADQVARMKRIFDYADQTGQPCVITYSIGFDDEPGESQLFREALQTMLGPGRILVAAAGNEGLNWTYVHKPVGVETAGAGLKVNKPACCYLTSAQPFRLKCIAYKQDIDLVTMSPRYVFTDSLTFDTEALPTDSLEMRGHHIILTHTGAWADGRKVYTLADRWEDVGLDDLKVLAFAIEGKEADVEVHTGCSSNLAKISSPFTTDTRFSNVESSHNVGLPGSLPEVVTVGALKGRDSYLNAAGDTIVPISFKGPLGTVARFSSIGPTISGISKPDVVAPGVNVISAGNSYHGDSFGKSMVAKTTFNGREYPWVAMSGTSMATPCAAGIVALWLQADPTLTPDRIKEIMRKTCRKPDETLDYPNNIYGHGLIDAYAGMLQVLNIPSAIPGISTHQPRALRIMPAEGHAVSLTFDTPPVHPFSVSVYTLSGQRLASECVQPDGSTRYLVALPSQSHGICVVQVNSREQGVTGSGLVRF